METKNFVDYEKEIKTKQNELANVTTELANATARLTKEISDLKMIQTRELILKNAKNYERMINYLTEVSKQTFNTDLTYMRIVYFTQVTDTIIQHKFAKIQWTKSNGKTHIGVQDILEISIDNNIVAKLKGRIFDDRKYNSKKTPATVNDAFDKARIILSNHYKSKHNDNKLANDITFAWVLSLVGDYFDNILHTINTAKKYNL